MRGDGRVTDYLTDHSEFNEQSESGVGNKTKQRNRETKIQRNKETKETKGVLSRDYTGLMRWLQGKGGNMRKQKNKFNRLAAMAAAGALVLSNMPVSLLAAEEELYLDEITLDGAENASEGLEENPVEDFDSLFQNWGG